MAMVDLPELSRPKISMILPFGYPGQTNAPSSRRLPPMRRLRTVEPVLMQATRKDGWTITSFKLTRLSMTLRHLSSFGCQVIPLFFAILPYPHFLSSEASSESRNAKISGLIADLVGRDTSPAGI